LRVVVRSTSGKFLKNLLGWTGSVGMSDARAFLQERVKLYVKVLVGFLAISWVSARLGHLLFHGVDFFIDQVVDPLSLVHLVLTLGLTGDLVYLSRAERKLWILHGYEFVGTIMVAVTIAFLLTLFPEGMPALAALPFLILVLVARASVVPSSAARTFTVGVLSTLSVSVAAFVTLEPSTEAIDYLGRELQVAALTAWGVAFSIVTAIISRVIYGLTERVREALELGQYRLVEKLGEGGMGSVYRGEHALLKRPTAIKLLPPDKAGEEAVRRFEREVVQTSRLANPHTVAIYDFGRTPDGIFYYAMEYLEGIDLQDLIEVDGPQDPRRVVRILHAMAESLREAHDEGLVHRDVKPANVILCNRGGLLDMVKVVDFGLVKEVSGAVDMKLSAAHAITGTPLYLSPEAITAPDSIDGRADIYALGAVAYFLLTGEPVFESENVVEVCADHLHRAPDRPSERLGEPIPADLEGLVLRCLAKKPAERLDADELMSSLDALQVRPWTDTDAKNWWSQSAEVVEAHLQSKRTSVEPQGPVTLALMKKPSVAA